MQKIPYCSPYSISFVINVHFIAFITIDFLSSTSSEISEKNRLFTPSLDCKYKMNFTRKDETFAEAYTENRLVLRRLWDLAETYPNVASRIHMEIYQADPKRDYHYESKFADAAIVVKLSWLNEKETCDFLSCNSHFPKGRSCQPTDSPHVFPSGDYTILTACEPACYLKRESRDRGVPVYPRISYQESRYRVMSKNGTWTNERANDKDDVQVNKQGEVVDHQKHRASVNVDMPALQMVDGYCEIDNSGVTTFVTQPYYRSTMHDECRVSNFHIGDDLVKVSLNDESLKERELLVTSGRHSRTYCQAFDKRFNESTATCEETWLDTVLGFTFLGHALLRLTRHAIHGSGCETFFRTATERKDTNEQLHDIPPYKISRRKWYEDVNKDWRLPPPNVLLSDLGIAASYDEPNDHVWSNRFGVRVRTKENISYDTYYGDVRTRARRELQIAHRRPTTTRVEDTSFDAGDRNKRDIDEKFDSSIVDYDRIYNGIQDRVQSVVNGERIAEIAKAIGELSGGIVLDSLAKSIAKRTFYRRILHLLLHDRIKQFIFVRDLGDLKAMINCKF